MLKFRVVSPSLSKKSIYSVYTVAGYRAGATGGLQGAVSPHLSSCAPSLLNAYPQENVHYIMQPLEADFWRFQFQ